MKNYQADWKKYGIVLLITAGIFAVAFIVSNKLNNEKIVELQQIQSKISTDILSSETQFSLLSEASCKTIKGSSILSKDLDSLGTRIAYMEEQISPNGEELLLLKRSYTLLEVKDYLLMKKVGEKCGEKPAFIFYFYSNKDGACPQCKEQGIVLTTMRQDYPNLRVYAFDYDLDLSTMKTLIEMYGIKSDALPALVINDETNDGFQSISDIKKLIPGLDKQKAVDAAGTTKTVKGAVKK